MTEVLSMYIPTILVAALALPLALRFIPPNHFYGVRTAQTLADREVWFRVNRVAGYALLGAAGIASLIYKLKPELASAPSFLSMLVLVGAVILALIVTSIYSRSLSH